VAACPILDWAWAGIDCKANNAVKTKAEHHLFPNLSDM
jgi:hypothetical protein